MTKNTLFARRFPYIVALPLVITFCSSAGCENGDADVTKNPRATANVRLMDPQAEPTRSVRQTLVSAHEALDAARFDLAQAIAERGIVAHGEHPRLRWVIAKSHEERGQLGEATKSYRRIIDAIDPTLGHAPSSSLDSFREKQEALRAAVPNATATMKPEELYGEAKEHFINRRYTLAADLALRGE